MLEQIGDLKSEYGSALLLHYAGYAHGEVGEILGCSAEAARKLVARARAKLVSQADSSSEDE